MVYSNYDEADVLCTENLSFPSFKMSNSRLLSVYTFRYWMVRTLTCNVPYLPSWLIRKKSLLEVFFIIASFIILMYTSIGLFNTQTSGQLANNLGNVMICSALRNNFFTFSLGISYERAIEWHKIAAILTLFLAACHVYQNRERIRDKSGLILYGFMILTSLIYLFKKKMFEYFYFLHIGLFLAIVIIGYIHGAKYFIASLILWLFDVSVRYYFRAHQVEAEFTFYDNDVIRLDISFLFIDF